MKKLLLIAALAAVALGASAQDYTFEKVWELNDLSFLTTAECRQGFGMNGKFYINDKATQTVYEVDQNGLTGVTFAGGTNCGITRDEAGNIVVSTAEFPGVWGAEAGIRVINPATGEFVDYVIPEECAVQGRCDFLGFAKGNLMEDGEIFIAGATQSGVCRLVITSGDIDFDNSYVMTIDGVTPSTSTVLNYYTDVNGEEAVLYVTRNAPLKKMAFDGDNFAGTTVALPGKGACNGTTPFVFDGKEFFIYPTTPNYQNGFAIAENNAEAAFIEVPSTVAGNANTFQGDWFNAEVDANGVTIYQYYPGGNITVYRLSKAVETPKVYILGEVNDNVWDPTSGVEMEYDAENDVYVANVNLDGRGESGENYFSFTTELAENNDEGGWAYIKPFRFGAADSEGDFWYDSMYDGQPLGLTYDNGQAFRVMYGNYEMIVSLTNMTLTMHQWALGDVNHDKAVDVSDVTALITYVLNGEGEGVYLDESNCDFAEGIDVSDVTALITYVLNGSW